MRDILSEIEAWLADGRQVAVATVVKVWGSAPRPLGAKMAVTAEGGMAGSVSGGCVEGAIVEEAQSVLATGTSKLVSFGVSNDDAFAVGLTCGGTIEIFIERLMEPPPYFDRLRGRGLFARAVVLDGPDAGRWRILESGAEPAEGDLGRDDLDRAAEERATQAFADFAAHRGPVGDAPAGHEGPADLFVEVHPPPPRLILVGAVHVAVALVHLAKVAGFETIVVDPRTAFATAERFAHADRLVHDWPDAALRSIGVDANTYVALLSHDLKLDIPALEVALPAARYVGALGSRKTHQKRLARLAEAGIDGPIVERIHNPIGLDLGGRRAEEMAVAVLAEIVGVSHGVDYRPPPAS